MIQYNNINFWFGIFYILHFNQEPFQANPKNWGSYTWGFTSCSVSRKTNIQGNIEKKVVIVPRR